MWCPVPCWAVFKSAARLEKPDFLAIASEISSKLISLIEVMITSPPSSL